MDRKCLLHRSIIPEVLLKSQNLLLHHESFPLPALLKGKDPLCFGIPKIFLRTQGRTMSCRRGSEKRVKFIRLHFFCKRNKKLICLFMHKKTFFWGICRISINPVEFLISTYTCWVLINCQSTSTTVGKNIFDTFTIFTSNPLKRTLSNQNYMKL